MIDWEDKGLVYDPRFDDLEVVDIPIEDCVKERLLDVRQAGIERSDYVTLDELQEIFSCSRYQIDNYLKAVKAEPLGELKNVAEGGKRMRGVGKLVYSKEVVDEITSLKTGEIDIEAIRRQAMSNIES